MVERIRTALQAAGDEIRDFLERLYVPEEPGRFRLCLAGATPAGARIGLTPSCMALRIARSVGLWERVDKDEQGHWIGFIVAHQQPETLGDEPATAGAFLDPEVVAAVRPAGARISRFLRRSRAPSPLEDLARAATRTAVGALAAVDAYPRTPYRSLPSSPAQLEAELRRSDWRQPAAAAARCADLIALVMSQGRHFLELPDLHRLREVAARTFEALADPESGAFFLDGLPRRSELIAAAAQVLDALDWIGRPVPRPNALVDTCLASQPGRDCDLADWVRVLHHCRRATQHRHVEVQASALEALDTLLGRRHRDGGWSLRPEGMATHDGPLEVSDGRPGGDLLGTERGTTAAGMLVELLEWDTPRWQVLRR